MWTFSYSPGACLYRGVSLTLLMLVFVRRFPLTPRVNFSKEFLIHFPFWFSLLRSFSYTPHALFIREEFLLHSWCYFCWGISLTHLMLCLFVRSFSYTPHAVFIRGEFLLHSWCYVYSWGVSLTLLMLLLVRSFSYPPHASFSEEFLLHSPY